MLPAVSKSFTKGLVAAERIGSKILGIVGIVVAATTLIPVAASAAGNDTPSSIYMTLDSPVLLISGIDVGDDVCFRGHRSHYSHRSHHSHYSSRR
jgi:hypothetical protein